MATTLSRGQVAIVGVNTEDSGNPQRDSISFILLSPITTGTVIFFTDRAWNGTTFAAAGSGEGTFTYTAGTNLAAGTVITINQSQLTAAGINLSDAGETIYVYQGSNANTPTTFLHALDVADGNSTFNGNLVNTGLVTGVSAVAVADDNLEFGSRTHNISAPDLFLRLNDSHRWVHNDNSPQDGTNGLNAVTGAGTSDPAFTAPDAQIWVGGSGGGEAIVTINLDQTYGAGTLGYQIVQAFQNDASLFHPSDITLDTVHGKFFFVDSDAVGHNRIVEGSISQLLNNPGDPATFTILYSNSGSGSNGVIQSLSVDTTNGIIYFDVGNSSTGSAFDKITYSLTGASTANQVPTQLASLGAGHFVTQMAIDYAHGTVLLATSRVIAVFGTDVVEQNYVYVATGLTSGSASLTFTELPFNPDDNDAGGINNANIPGLPGEAWPVERGTIRGIDIDPVTQIAYIATGSVRLDVSAAQDGSQMQTFFGGIYSYALTGNPNGNVTTIFQQNGTTGPLGLLHHIEVDHATGRYYVVDETGTNASSEDGGVWTGVLGVSATPTLVSYVGNINGLGPQGLEIQHAPTLTGTSLGANYTEAGGSPSPNGTAVTTANSFNSTDVDSGGAANGDELAGAQVRISGNFQSGAGHADQLVVSSFTSGTNQNGTIVIGGDTVAYSYNAATGVMTFTGVTTLDNYENILARIQFRSDGDNPTNYGTAGSRTISYSTFDGLLYSDEVNATVSVTGINDAPINVVPSAQSFNEDTVQVFSTANGNALSVSDVDADPAAQALEVTLTVTHGTLTLGSLAGLSFSVGDGTGDTTMTFTGTANAINAALGASGLSYTPVADYNGSDTLTFTVNDQGFNGNDPGATGTGTSEQDSDTVTLTINPVADIANDAPTTNEDTQVNVLVQSNDTFENPAHSITGFQQGAHGSVTLNDNGTAGNTADDYLVYTPNADYNGADSFTYTITSGGVTETATVNVSVTAVADVTNDSPTVLEDSGSNEFDVLANDSFEAANYQITGITQGTNGAVTIDTHGTADTTDDTVTYTPNGNFFGSDSFTYTVTSGGVTETGTVNVTVTAVDDPAVAKDDSFSTDEATAITGGNLFADHGSGADADIDGPALSISEVNGSAASVGTQISLASGALLTVNANGTFDYDPNGAFDYLPTLASGGSNTPASDSFTYTLAGGGTATVVVSISGLDSDDIVLGTPSVDTLSGGIGADTIFGFDSDDNIDGGTGADFMAGGLGNDTYIVDNTGDVAHETFGAGSDAVQSSVSYILKANVENLVLTGSNAINGRGNALSNNITGNGAANMLNGFGGADTMTGGLGDDTYVVDDAGDLVVEASGSGNDLVRSAIAYTLGSEIENLDLTGTASINGTGNSLANVISGNSGDNVLDGQGGADAMHGGGGDDTYVVDDLGDLAKESANEGTDNVETSVTFKLSNNVENLALAGSGAINGTGNDLANEITGNDSANRLDGRGGADTLTGGLGDDVYIVDNAGDIVSEGSGAGTDKVRASITYTLGDNLEILNLTGAASIDGTGNALHNILRGNSGANILNGLSGADTLIGGGGNDTFVFDTALGGGNVDSILDFTSGADHMLLDSAIFTALAGSSTLDPSAFHTGTSAHDADDRIIYNSATGNIYYDANGSDHGGQVLFAHVTPGTVLTSADFLIGP